MHINPRTLFLQEHGYPGITLAPAPVHGLSQLCQRQVGEPHRHIELPAHFHRQGHILPGQAEGEVWRVKMAWQEMLRQTVEGLPPTERPVTYGLP